MTLPSGVPWRSADEWAQIEWFFERSRRGLANPAALAAEARAIAAKLEAVDSSLEGLCRQSCPGCSDSCCGRATVWYDFRDLLLLFWLQGRLPSRQICKTRSKGCPHLQRNGCRLPRIERPFLCTWYLCPAQLTIVRSSSASARLRHLEAALTAIKQRRRGLEELFLEMTTPFSAKFGGR